ncbi:metal ABC transporter permease [Desulfolithobacter sp.]
MLQFLRDFQQFTFLQHALLAGMLASVACGIIGSYVTVRRMTYVTGAIAHCTLGGMGIARYLQKTRDIDWFSPLLGAILAALAAALTISFLQHRTRARQDSVLSGIWAVGMAIGILFIARTPGYNEDLMSYLFGDILMVSSADLLLITLLDLLVLGTMYLCYPRLLALGFDEEFARLTGVLVERYNTLFLCLVALTVVLLVQVVGIVLVVALLALPAAAASKLTSRLPAMMLVSVFFSMLATGGGLALSYGPDLPTGATIILVCAAIFATSGLLKRLGLRHGKLSGSLP